MSDLIYCYPESNVLKNKLNIRDAEHLQKAERILVSLRLNDLLEEPVLGRFDLMHLRKIHHYLFRDVYAWAGEIQAVDIAKSNWFCKVEFIVPQTEKLFAELKNDAYLTSLSRDEFVKKCAYYFSEINALHPFREKEVTKGDANISTFQPEGADFFYALFSLIFEIIISNQHTKVDVSNTS